ncbi:hypothetical protein GJ496_004619 [Pomphorhynchus laevis]|nr:hypothetical protein GJ496_004619 [Pomphorhynchus laevis]
MDDNNIISSANELSENQQMRLVDYVVIVGLDFDHRKDPHSRQFGRILQRFPTNDWSDNAFNPAIVHFCQPKGWRTYREYEPPSFFVFVLTDQYARRQYCGCLTFFELASSSFAKCENSLEKQLNSSNMANEKFNITLEDSKRNYLLDMYDHKVMHSNSILPKDVSTDAGIIKIGTSGIPLLVYETTDHNGNASKIISKSTNMSSQHQQASSCCFYSPKCIVLVSRSDYFSTFKSCLKEIYLLYATNQDVNKSYDISESFPQKQFNDDDLDFTDNTIINNYQHPTTTINNIGCCVGYRCYSKQESLLLPFDEGDTKITTTKSANIIQPLTQFSLQPSLSPSRQTIIKGNSRSYQNKRKILLELVIGKLIGHIKIPRVGGKNVIFSLHTHSNYLHHLQCRKYTYLPATDNSVHMMFQQLGINNVLTIFEACLMELKILFVSRNYCKLNDACRAIESLIYPLRYCHVFIPVLPYDMLGIVEAPTPYIIGVHADHLEKVQPLCDSSILVVNIDVASVEFTGIHNSHHQHLHYKHGQQKGRSQNYQPTSSNNINSSASTCLPACLRDPLVSFILKIMQPNENAYWNKDNDNTLYERNPHNGNQDVNCYSSKDETIITANFETTSYIGDTKTTYSTQSGRLSSSSSQPFSHTGATDSNEKTANHFSTIKNNGSRLLSHRSLSASVDALLRAVFCQFFVTILKTYRKYLLVIRVYPKPVIVLNKQKFLIDNDFHKVDFLKRLIETMLFHKFIEERGLPFRNLDLFDYLCEDENGADSCSGSVSNDYIASFFVENENTISTNNKSVVEDCKMKLDCQFNNLLKTVKTPPSLPFPVLNTVHVNQIIHMKNENAYKNNSNVVPQSSIFIQSAHNVDSDCASEETYLHEHCCQSRLLLHKLAKQPKLLSHDSISNIVENDFQRFNPDRNPSAAMRIGIGDNIATRRQNDDPPMFSSKLALSNKILYRDNCRHLCDRLKSVSYQQHLRCSNQSTSANTSESINLVSYTWLHTRRVKLLKRFIHFLFSKDLLSCQPLFNVALHIVRTYSTERRIFVSALLNYCDVSNSELRGWQFFLLVDMLDATIEGIAKHKDFEVAHWIVKIANHLYYRPSSSSSRFSKTTSESFCHNGNIENNTCCREDNQGPPNISSYTLNHIVINDYQHQPLLSQPSYQSSTMSVEDYRYFIHSALKPHKIWIDEAFWQMAFYSDLQQQLAVLYTFDNVDNNCSHQRKVNACHQQISSESCCSCSHCGFCQNKAENPGYHWCDSYRMPKDSLNTLKVMDILNRIHSSDPTPCIPPLLKNQDLLEAEEQTISSLLINYIQNIINMWHPIILLCCRSPLSSTAASATTKTTATTIGELSITTTTDNYSNNNCDIYSPIIAATNFVNYHKKNSIRINQNDKVKKSERRDCESGGSRNRSDNSDGNVFTRHIISASRRKRQSSDRNKYLVDGVGDNGGGDGDQQVSMTTVKLATFITKFTEQMCSDTQVSDDKKSNVLSKIEQILQVENEQFINNMLCSSSIIYSTDETCRGHTHLSTKAKHYEMLIFFKQLSNRLLLNIECWSKNLSNNNVFLTGERLLFTGIYAILMLPTAINTMSNATKNIITIGEKPNQRSIYNNFGNYLKQVPMHGILIFTNYRLLFINIGDSDYYCRMCKNCLKSEPNMTITTSSPYCQYDIYDIEKTHQCSSMNLSTIASIVSMNFVDSVDTTQPANYGFEVFADGPSSSTNQVYDPFGHLLPFDKIAMSDKYGNDCGCDESTEDSDINYDNDRIDEIIPPTSNSSSTSGKNKCRQFDSEDEHPEFKRNIRLTRKQQQNQQFNSLVNKGQKWDHQCDDGSFHPEIHFSSVNGIKMKFIFPLGIVQNEELLNFKQNIKSIFSGLEERQPFFIHTKTFESAAKTQHNQCSTNSRHDNNINRLTTVMDVPSSTLVTEPAHWDNGHDDFRCEKKTSIVMQHPHYTPLNDSNRTKSSHPLTAGLGLNKSFLNADERSAEAGNVVINDKRDYSGLKKIQSIMPLRMTIASHQQHSIDNGEHLINGCNNGKEHHRRQSVLYDEHASSKKKHDCDYEIAKYDGYSRYVMHMISNSSSCSSSASLLSRKKIKQQDNFILPDAVNISCAVTAEDINNYKSNNAVVVQPSTRHWIKDYGHVVVAGCAASSEYTASSLNTLDAFINSDNHNDNDRDKAKTYKLNEYFATDNIKSQSSSLSSDAAAALIMGNDCRCNRIDYNDDQLSLDHRSHLQYFASDYSIINEHIRKIDPIISYDNDKEFLESVINNVQLSSTYKQMYAFDIGLLSEYKRMNILKVLNQTDRCCQEVNNSNVQIIYHNRDFSLCSTYPQLVAIPTFISTNNNQGTQFSSPFKALAYQFNDQRFPVVVYRHWRNKALLIRSAKPIAVNGTYLISDISKRLLNKTAMAITNGNNGNSVDDNSNVIKSKRSKLIVVNSACLPATQLSNNSREDSMFTFSSYASSLQSLNSLKYFNENKIYSMSPFKNGSVNIGVNCYDSEAALLTSYNHNDSKLTATSVVTEEEREEAVTIPLQFDQLPCGSSSLSSSSMSSSKRKTCKQCKSATTCIYSTNDYQQRIGLYSTCAIAEARSLVGSLKKSTGNDNEVYACSTTNKSVKFHPNAVLDPYQLNLCRRLVQSCDNVDSISNNNKTNGGNNYSFNGDSDDECDCNSNDEVIEDHREDLMSSSYSLISSKGNIPDTYQHHHDLHHSSNANNYHHNQLHIDVPNHKYIDTTAYNSCSTMNSSRCCCSDYFSRSAHNDERCVVIATGQLNATGIGSSGDCSSRIGRRVAIKRNRLKQKADCFHNIFPSSLKICMVSVLLYHAKNVRLTWSNWIYNIQLSDITLKNQQFQEQNMYSINSHIANKMFANVTNSSSNNVDHISNKKATVFKNNYGNFIQRFFSSSSTKSAVLTTTNCNKNLIGSSDLRISASSLLSRSQKIEGSSDAHKLADLVNRRDNTMLNTTTLLHNKSYNNCEGVIKFNEEVPVHNFDDTNNKVKEFNDYKINRQYHSNSEDDNNDDYVSFNNTSCNRRYGQGDIHPDNNHQQRFNSNNTNVASNRLIKLFAGEKPETNANASPESKLKFSYLGSSDWLYQIYNLIQTAWQFKQFMDCGKSVLLSLEQGITNTAQLSALVQVLSDPYYRTVKGFISLMQKEWLDMGYCCLSERSVNINNHSGQKSVIDDYSSVSENCVMTQKAPTILGKSFAKRSTNRTTSTQNSSTELLFMRKRLLKAMTSSANTTATTSSSTTSNEKRSRSMIKITAPWIVQFLDAVHQLVRKCPTVFEFNDFFLQTICYFTDCSRFYQFNFSCQEHRHQLFEQLRKQKNLNCLRDLWKYLLTVHQILPIFLNPLYSNALSPIHTAATGCGNNRCCCQQQPNKDVTNKHGTTISKGSEIDLSNQQHAYSSSSINLGCLLNDDTTNDPSNINICSGLHKQHNEQNCYYRHDEYFYQEDNDCLVCPSIYDIDVWIFYFDNFCCNSMPVYDMNFVPSLLRRCIRKHITNIITDIERKNCRSLMMSATSSLLLSSRTSTKCSSAPINICNSEHQENIQQQIKQTNNSKIITSFIDSTNSNQSIFNGNKLGCKRRSSSSSRSKLTTTWAWNRHRRHYNLLSPPSYPPLSTPNTPTLMTANVMTSANGINFDNNNTQTTSTNYIISSPVTIGNRFFAVEDNKAVLGFSQPSSDNDDDINNKQQQTIYFLSDHTSVEISLLPNDILVHYIYCIVLSAIFDDIDCACSNVSSQLNNNDVIDFYKSSKRPLVNNSGTSTYSSALWNSKISLLEVTARPYQHSEEFIQLRSIHNNQAQSPSYQLHQNHCRLLPMNKDQQHCQQQSIDDSLEIATTTKSAYTEQYPSNTSLSFYSKINKMVSTEIGNINSIITDGSSNRSLLSARCNLSHLMNKSAILRDKEQRKTKSNNRYHYCTSSTDMAIAASGLVEVNCSSDIFDKDNLGRIDSVNTVVKAADCNISHDNCHIVTTTNSIAGGVCQTLNGLHSYTFPLPTPDASSSPPSLCNYYLTADGMKQRAVVEDQQDYTKSHNQSNYKYTHFKKTDHPRHPKKSNSNYHIMNKYYSINQSLVNDISSLSQPIQSRKASSSDTSYCLANSNFVTRNSRTAGGMTAKNKIITTLMNTRRQQYLTGCSHSTIIMEGFLHKRCSFIRSQWKPKFAQLDERSAKLYLYSYNDYTKAINRKQQNQNQQFNYQFHYNHADYKHKQTTDNDYHNRRSNGNNKNILTTKDSEADADNRNPTDFNSTINDKCFINIEQLKAASYSSFVDDPVDCDNVDCVDFDANVVTNNLRRSTITLKGLIRIERPYNDGIDSNGGNGLPNRDYHRYCHNQGCNATESKTQITNLETTRVSCERNYTDASVDINGSNYANNDNSRIFALIFNNKQYWFAVSSPIEYDVWISILTKFINNG